jgi:nitroreductase
MNGNDIDSRGNEFLDRVIEDRRTIRVFTAATPPRKEIEAVIKAGLLAPYSPMSVGDEEVFRRFFVMEAGSRARAAAVEMVKARVVASAKALGEAVEADPGFGRVARPFLERISSVASGGELGLESPPYYIVVAEKKGFPPVEQHSLAHCLENMWLKATALGLGFRLISATAQMADDEGFCRLLGLPGGEFGIDGCVVGYAAGEFPPARRPTFGQAVKWLD